MAIHPFLCRLVVIRRDGKRRIGANLFGILSQINGLRSRIGARTGNNGDSPGGLLYHDSDQLMMFIEIDRRRLACRADHDNGVGPFLDMVVDQLPQ